MEPMTLVVAGITALAILLIAFGLASSGGSSGVTARLERYASGKPEKAKSTASGQGTISDLLEPEHDAGQPEQGRRAARLRCEPVARPRPRRPQAQAERVPVPVGRGDRRHPAGDDRCCRSSSPALGNPLLWVIGALVGFWLPRFWLGRRKNGRLERLQQAAAGHDHPDRQRAARRLVVPPGDRAGRPRVASADLDRVRPGHPRGQPRPAVRSGAREHGPPRAVGRPRADGHGHLHPAHRSVATSPRSSTRSRSRSASASGSRARSAP